MDLTQPVVLTIAGSDSSGGAGLQADLKTFATLNCIGTSAVTCVTAQTPLNVNAIEPVRADMVSNQIRAACDAFPVAAAKTGMLYSSSIISAVAEAITSCNIVTLVIDPVMMASSGARLLEEDAIKAFCSKLMPMATVVTPNLPEAEVLCGHKIASTTELEMAAREIGDRFEIACVVKGGHMREGVRERRSGNERKAPKDGKIEVTDVLYYEGKTTAFSSPRIDTGEIHGTGCVFSAALTAFLAHGHGIVEAVGYAKDFVTRAIEHASMVGQHAVLSTTGVRILDQ